MTGSKDCPKCGAPMQMIHQERHIFCPDRDTMTDGQLADQLASEMGGFFEEGVHGTTSRIFECTVCEKQVEER